jgi:hypothetical protein
VETSGVRLPRSACERWTCTTAGIFILCLSSPDKTQVRSKQVLVALWEDGMHIWEVSQVLPLRRYTMVENVYNGDIVKKRRDAFRRSRPSFPAPRNTRTGATGTLRTLVDWPKTHVGGRNTTRTTSWRTKCSNAQQTFEATLDSAPQGCRYVKK